MQDRPFLTFVSPSFHLSPRVFGESSAPWDGQRNYSIPSKKRKRRERKKAEKIRNVNHREGGRNGAENERDRDSAVRGGISWGWSLKFMINCTFPEYQRSSFDVARLRRKFSPFRDHGGDLLARGMSALGLL